MREEFTVLMQRGKANHFKYGMCPRRLNTAGDLAGQCTGLKSKTIPPSSSSHLLNSASQSLTCTKPYMERIPYDVTDEPDALNVVGHATKPAKVNAHFSFAMFSSLHCVLN